MTSNDLALAWSTGKDSAHAMQTLVDEGSRPGCLFTTVISKTVPMHNANISVATAQAEAMGLPLITVELPQPYEHEVYLQRLQNLRAESLPDIKAVAFGDRHLEDLRDRREQDLSRAGLKGKYPLWAVDTTEAAHHIVECGIVATIATVDTQLAPAELLGQPFNERAIALLLAAGADPCGENGEIHTIVTDAEFFSGAIALTESARFTTGRYHYIEYG